MNAALLVYRHLIFSLASIVVVCFAGEAMAGARTSIDAIDWAAAQMDLTFLNKPEQPAGKRGFVKVKGDALVFSDGSPARFWGTNITAAALFLSDSASVKLHAQRLSRLGFNLVRLHHHDSSWSRPNIFGPEGSVGTRRLDAAMLEKIDWWIKCLKDEGIYVWLDLHVLRDLHRSDGIANFDDMAKGKDAVGLKGFNYVNDDIEKAMMAFNEAYLGHVNAFTGLAYKNDPAVAAVLITNENDLTEHYGNALLPNQKVPKHSALYMAQARAFARAHGLPEDRVWRSWEQGPSKIFLNDLEHRFDLRMIAHLRRIGVKVPIVTTNLWGSQYSSLPALATADMVDVHAYEDPGFLNRDPALGGTLVHTIAMAHVAGMPVSVTEWNMGRFPDADRAVLPIFVAASASHQGWDALMHYAYAQTPLQLPAAPSNWHALNDPARLAMLPAAALMFRQQHVREAATAYSWSPGASELFDAPLSAGWLVRLRLAAEKGRLATSLPRVEALPWIRATNAPAGSINVDKPKDDEADRRDGEVLSDTRELHRDWRAGIFSVDTSRSQAAGGRIGGKEIALSNVKLRMSNAFASVVVQALDSKSIVQSGDILVSAASSSSPSENTGLPFLGEPLIGDVEIQGLDGLRSSEQAGVQVRREAGRYIVHFDGKAPVHWVSLRGASKGER